MMHPAGWSRVRAAAVGALAVGALALGSLPAQAQAPTTTLKMQATWPASLTLYENFTFWAERVNKLSAGTLKIDTMPAGQVVPAFEVLDATHKKVLDGAHAWAGYWVGKNKAAILVTGGPGGTFGMDFIDYMGWVHNGGGFELLTEFYQKELKLNVVWLPVLPSGPQAFGWFKRPIKNLADFKGMKCRQTGMAAEVWQRMGMTTVNMPGGEIIPSAQRGVIDCAEWVGGVEDLRLGFHNVWKYHYTPGMHEPVTMGELLINILRWPAMLAIVMLGLSVIYRYGPCRADAKWRWITWGSVAAALLWFIVSMLFSWYASNFGNYNKTYGSLGAVIAFMMWSWLSTTIVLMGGELNAEIEHQTAKDSTTGPPKPLGARGAKMADTVGAAQN